jgi:hypothetical protein
MRFRGHYYNRHHQCDSYYEGLGAHIVGSIPTDPDEYINPFVAWSPFANVFQNDLSRCGPNMQRLKVPLEKMSA